MTEGEYTNYVFDISSDYLSEALDIFAQCFISPKLNADSAEREIRAIESEYNLAKMSDSARSQEVLCSCTNEGHFYRKFSWGNMKSLSENPSKKGINVNACLREFYNKYYYPQNMKLVVVAPSSFEDMIKMVSESFEGFKAGVIAEIPSYGGLPFQNSQPCVARYEPIKNLHRVDIHWVIPVCNDGIHYRKKCDRYISHLIGHEGPGSLLSYLKQKGLATQVFAGVSSKIFLL
jgi:secreted Zn-dependent insulinase-like peptidase